jgi:signal transduction histidine kinase
MNRSIQFKNHPFRFLLYLEWVLLIVAILTAIMPFPAHRYSKPFPELTICSLIIFGLMGLYLPTGNKIIKIFYTAIEIFLILIVVFFSGRTARLFPFPYLIFVTRSCFIFQLPGRLISAVISFVLFLLTFRRRLERMVVSPIEQERLWFFTLNFVLVFGLILVFILLLMNTVLSERQSREKLAIANEKLRQYALQIENQATLEERNRIAREIHDSLGHSLTALNLQLETALKLWQSNPEKARTFLATAKELGSSALQDVRQSVSTMRSHPLQEKSLEQAILELLDNLQRSTNITSISHIQLPDSIPIEISTPIYRIIQESLTNIYKHAKATEVRLELIMIDKSLQLKIQDNGVGFDLTQNTTGFGLKSMRDRTLSLGGHFHIQSDPGSGCTITVKIMNDE